ncbi:uncharacterized protein [Diadema setosum]|uniref:uncharacterized protein n=1 Tax=Diadema setosum TaxID=31175 RepID=UPI003B3B3380
MPTIGVCTSDMETNIQALLTRLREISNADIKFVKLPYNDVESYPLDSMNVDGIILCHSKHNRRFAITDVTDALYDGFLSNAKRVFGKDNVAVIGHDFKWPFGDGESVEGHARVKKTRMACLEFKQPTAFQCSRLVLICGRLDGRVEMDEDDWQMLQHFVVKFKPRPLFGIENLTAHGRTVLWGSALVVTLSASRICPSSLIISFIVVPSTLWTSLESGVACFV